MNIIAIMVDFEQGRPKGSIGLAGFRAIINYPGTGDLPGIIETPMEPEGMDATNLGVLQGLEASQGTRG